MHEICSKRYQGPPPTPKKMTVFLHAIITHPGEGNTEMKALILDESGTGFNNALNLTVNSVAPPSSFTAALLVGLLWVLQNSNPNTELVICTSTDYLTKAFVVNRSFHENDMLDANFGLGRAVLGALNERCGRVRFKKVLQNPALTLKSQAAQTASLDTDIDMMFNCPVILISNGTQRLFTKIINSLKPSPCRKTTEINLDRIRCCVQEASGYLPTDKAIWTSIRYEDSLPDDWIRSDRVLGLIYNSRRLKNTFLIPVKFLTVPPGRVQGRAE
ncbi:hypothetical protein B0H16DRAFT_1465995 [Mycena metata]|uniref:Uncharacterized protein n=1 Tax=Mycena metata TaxID=1033252 RepID=A0AAD7I9G2_9AGAR|nr:hypothetical protein B0H16DRAFT_1465995 [Mycena metata]